ncbi:hypothetical protein AAGG74_18385 [Bacillus mexicanus]|uniref:hypothetical protein n=1 Tax=Bacillus mexicanus TaxID=2834415 RepID=UPI003D1DF3E9
MKEKINKEFSELFEMMLKTKDSKDIGIFNEKIEYINGLIKTYNGNDREEYLKLMLIKNEEIKQLLQEKMDVLKEKIIQEDELNRNRGTYRLYE